MSDRSKRYLELLNEKEWHRATSGLSRGAEIAYAARLDRLWIQLSEADQEAIEQELQSLGAGEISLGADADVIAGGHEAPRKVA